MWCVYNVCKKTLYPQNVTFGCNAPIGTPDRDVPTCQICEKTKFDASMSLKRPRRHHCKACGKVKSDVQN